MVDELLSIVVPVYGVELFLERCVESIIAQSYVNTEIILVDDGSIDSCGFICDNLASQERRITVIHQKNRGLSGARNSGKKMSTGVYISFIDSDDTIDPNMYSCMMSAVSNSDLVICGNQIIQNDQMPVRCRLTNKSFVELNYEQLWEEIFGRLNNSVCNKIYKKRLSDNLWFIEGLIHGEDLLFNLQYLSKSINGKLIRENFYHYYNRSSSITNSTFSANAFSEITAKDMAFEFVKNHNPGQVKNAMKYCFRARMNVLRSIIICKKENDYYNEMQNISEYLINNYRGIRKQLKIKERVEFDLFMYSKWLYHVVLPLVVK